MPKFGQVQFNEDYFGDGRVPKTFRKQSIHGIPLGVDVRRSIAKEVTFRVRTGNGHYGSVAGHKYQDKFALVVPSSIDHPNGDSSRACFAAAISAWQGLSAGAKKIYNNLAGHVQHLSGYNLFIRRYMQENYS